jgi:predicted nucleic acid-binding protein
VARRARRECVGRKPAWERRLSSILVDTSFLITLADPARRHHEAAKTYLRESLKANVPLYLSAIVASEFQVKQAVNDLPLRNFIILPFNIDHAMTAGLLMRSINRDPGDERNSVKDDVKLIAQAVCESITHVLTEDEKTLAKYIKRLADAGECTLRAILLVNGFEAAWLNGGQAAIPGT